MYQTSQNKNKSHVATLFSVVMVLLLTACSGGDGNTGGISSPLNVQAVSGDEKITISWDAVTNADSYSVYWNTSSFVSDSDNVLITTERYTVHTSLINSTPYYYKVAATVSGQSGELSPQVTATPAEPSVGVNWDTRTSGTTNTLFDVTRGNSQYVAVGVAGTILTSPTGVTWTTQTSGVIKNLSSVIWNGSQYLVTGADDTILTSPNAINWTPRTSGTTNITLANASWDDSQYVIVGNAGTIITSPDAITWTSQTSNTANPLSGIVWNGSQFVVTGYFGSILTSPNGSTWTDRTYTDTSTFLYKTAWDGSKFIIAGTKGADGVLISSTDGITWAAQTSDTANLNFSINWNGSQYLSVGGGGTLQTSPDGIAWSAQTSGVTGNLWGVTWNGSLYVVVGDSGTIITSGTP